MTNNEPDARTATLAHETPQTTIVDIPPDVIATPTDQRPFLVLVNPVSGRGKSLKIYKKHVTKFFESRTINQEVFTTLSNFRVKDYLATKSTEELLNYRALIVVSGDGLVFELVNAVMARPDAQQVMTIPIGIIPTGSGNGLAHTLIGGSKIRVKSQREAVELCCKQAVQGETCSSDLVRITHDDGKIAAWSFLSIGWGLLANIDVDSDWLRRLGELRFTIYGLLRSLTSISRRGRLSFKPAGDATLIQNLRSESNSSGSMYQCKKQQDSSLTTGQKNPSPVQSQLVGDKTTASDQDGWIHIEDKFACLYAVHQSHISRTTQFAPRSTLSDGLIYLTYVRGKLNPCQVVEYLLSIDDGSHDLLPYVKVVPVRQFKFQPLEPSKIVVDGEKIEWTSSHGPLTAEVVPKAMKLLWTRNRA